MLLDVRAVSVILLTLLWFLVNSTALLPFLALSSDCGSLLLAGGIYVSRVFPEELEAMGEKLDFNVQLILNL
jgi:hypothetical protein